MPSVSFELMKVRATVTRQTQEPDGFGGWRATSKPAGTIMCRVTDAELVQREDQQGRIGTDLIRRVYCMPQTDIRPGDQLSINGLVLVVQSVTKQCDDAYTKALVIEDGLQPIWRSSSFSV